MSWKKNFCLVSQAIELKTLIIIKGLHVAFDTVTAQ